MIVLYTNYGGCRKHFIISVHLQFIGNRLTLDNMCWIDIHSLRTFVGPDEFIERGRGIKNIARDGVTSLR